MGCMQSHPMHPILGPLNPILGPMHPTHPMHPMEPRAASTGSSSGCTGSGTAAGSAAQSAARVYLHRPCFRQGVLARAKLVSRRRWCGVAPPARCPPVRFSSMTFSRIARRARLLLRRNRLPAAIAEKSLHFFRGHRAARRPARRPGPRRAPTNVPQRVTNFSRLRHICWRRHFVSD